jgi:hypothetical protein
MSLLTSAVKLLGKRLTDAAVDKLVVGVGPDLILTSLDRLTAPATNGTALPANNNNNSGDDEGKELHPRA